VLLSGGSTVTADEAYIRESILNPAAKVQSFNPDPSKYGFLALERCDIVLVFNREDAWVVTGVRPAILAGVRGRDAIPQDGVSVLTGLTPCQQQQPTKIAKPELRHYLAAGAVASVRCQQP
jgi:hypothetical protein